jgi:hypothetical protein
MVTRSAELASRLKTADIYELPVQMARTLMIYVFVALLAWVPLALSSLSGFGEMRRGLVSIY